MKQIFVMAAHIVFAALFFWNTFMFWRLDPVGRYVNLVAALLAVISALVYYLMIKRKKKKPQPAEPQA